MWYYLTDPNRNLASKKWNNTQHRPNTKSNNFIWLRITELTLIRGNFQPTRVPVLRRHWPRSLHWFARVKPIWVTVKIRVRSPRSLVAVTQPITGWSRISWEGTGVTRWESDSSGIGRLLGANVSDVRRHNSVTKSACTARHFQIRRRLAHGVGGSGVRISGVPFGVLGIDSFRRGWGRR